MKACAGASAGCGVSVHWLARRAWSWRTLRLGVLLLAAALPGRLPAADVGKVAVDYAFEAPRLEVAAGATRVALPGCEVFHRNGQPAVPFPAWCSQ